MPRSSAGGARASSDLRRHEPLRLRHRPLRRSTGHGARADRRRLFRRADAGEVNLTTSEAIIAEGVHVLTAKAQYGFTVDEVVKRLIPFVRSRGLSLDRPSVVHDALLVWRDHPNLGFIDALGAAYAKQPRVELATFDADLYRVPGIKRHDLASG